MTIFEKFGTLRKQKYESLWNGYEVLENFHFRL